MGQLQGPNMNKDMHGKWEFICTIMLRYIWSARCSKVLNGNIIHPIATEPNFG